MHIQFTYFPLSTFPVIHTEKKNHWKAQLEKFSALQKKEREGRDWRSKGRRYRKDYGLVVISPGILPVRLGK